MDNSQPPVVHVHGTYIKADHIEQVHNGTPSPPAREALAATVRRHQRRTRSTRPRVVVDNPHTSEIMSRLSTPDSPQVLVLHGPAGSGKSEVLASLLRRAEERGWTGAAIHMDAVQSGTLTAASVGRLFDLPTSPVLMFAQTPGILVVDQLDAVSQYSGRIPDSYDAVAEILEQAEALPHLKVVLAVRTADLHADPRMGWLLADEERVGGYELGLLSPVALREALDRAGVNTMLAPSTLDLLRTPLHFSVFSRLPAEVQALPHRSVTSLYEHLTKHVRNAVERRIGRLSWEVITTTLVGHMSDNESLQAPRALLDTVSENEVSALVSEGILVEHARAVGFLHETYFDFLFARTFVAQGRDLHDFLVESGQYLFRRAQTRQVLDYLADTDRPAFHRSVVRMLTSTSLRPHLQDIVVRVLERLPARAEDWTALEGLVFTPSRFQQRLAGLLSRKVWFDAADSAGRWEALLADPSTVDVAMEQLPAAASVRRDRVLELVWPYRDVVEWVSRLRALTRAVPSALADLTVDLITRGVHDDQHKSSWAKLDPNNPVGSARIVGAHLRRTQDLARESGGSAPFGTARTARDEAQILIVIACAAPEAFLREVLPFVAEAAESGDEQPFGFGSAIFVATEAAVSRASVEKRMLRRLMSSKTRELRFLSCLALVREPGDEAVDWLLSDDRNLTLGRMGDPIGASRKLVAAVATTCSDDRLAALCTMLLNHYPVGETLAMHGRTQHELLSVIPPDRRSPDVARRIAELSRKFDREPASPLTRTRSRVVDSPIDLDAAVRMRDQDWVRALGKHDALGLDEVLYENAAAAPERFAELATTFSMTVVPRYFATVLKAVSGKVPGELLSRLCLHAKAVHGSDVAVAVCNAAHDAATVVDNRMVRVLKMYGRDGDSDVRACAAGAIAHVLDRQPEHAERLITTVESLAADPVREVRVQAANAVTALLNTHAEQALDLAEQVFDDDVEIFGNPITCHLLGWALSDRPSRFGRHLRRALNGPAAVAKEAGQLWLGCHVRGELTDLTLGDLNAHARCGVALAMVHQPGTAPELLARLFNDTEPTVRSAAATAVRYLDEVPPTEARELITAFGTSRAFDEDSEALLHGRGLHHTLVPEVTMRACERLAAATTASVNPTLLTVVLRLYHQGHNEMRRRCLDVLDQLAEAGHHALEVVLEAER
ncbi:hypothetical protein [Allokutzneria oryzae]|uniref:AAA+ ATPase domain-containing protein n=1 Tax=Allokutzneria oryzae TaxID=1378989 RepID=A0ABV6A348_9PSEU